VWSRRPFSIFAEPTVVNGHVYAAGESMNNSYPPPNGVQGLCGIPLNQGGQYAGCLGAVTVWQ
jgi:hypothetical protein